MQFFHLEAHSNEVEDWLHETGKTLSVTSAGSNIEIFKGKGILLIL